MADVSQGPGWWQASDGRWYAPEQHPDYRPQTQVPPVEPASMPTYPPQSSVAATPQFGEAPVATGEPVHPQHQQFQPAPMGQQPPAYGAAQYPTAAKYLSIRTWAFAVMALLGVAGAVTAVLTVFRFQERSILNDPSSFTFAEVTASDDRIGAAGVVFIVVSLVCAAVLITWLYRAYANLDALRVGPRGLGKGWAIGGFFLPIANLVIPLMILLDTWRGGDVRAPNNPQWRRLAISPLIILWWVAFIGGNIAVRVGGSMIDNASTIDDGLSANLALTIASVVLSVAALLGVWCVWKMTERLDARRDELTQITI